MPKKKNASPKTVETLIHDEAFRKNIPTAEYQSVMQKEEQGFVRMVLENLKTAGVQQTHKEDKINFTSITPWPGELVCA